MSSRSAVRSGPVAASPKGKRSVWRILWKWTKVLFAVLFIAFAVGLTWVGFRIKSELDKANAKLPNLPVIMSERLKTPTVIKSADGKVLFKMQSQYRQPVEIANVPKNMVNATIAAEDIRFYEHDGIDMKALVRAVVTNFKEKRNAQGASTITMQLAKRIYSDSAQTFQRKLEDMAMAYTIERHYSKEQILELYLNEVFYGSGAYGIQAAADVYYGKKLDQLTLGECAMLARCVRRPSQENPFEDLASAVRNRDVVLDLMHENKLVTDEEWSKAKLEKPKLKPKHTIGVVAEKVAPYFVDYVLEVLHREMPGVDLSAGGYTIETTLNTQMQDIAEEQARKLVRRHQGDLVTTAAFLLMNRDGQVKAMVGGVDYSRNQYNVCTDGRRQPGSSFKPIVYATAIENHAISPNDSISNAPFAYKHSRKVVHGKGGFVSVGRAIASSLNPPALRTAEKAGPQNVVNTAHRSFGYTSDLDPVVSIGLGTSPVTMIEHAQAYSVFLRGGDRATPYVIRRVYGQDGEVVLDYVPRIVRHVLRQDTALVMDRFLRGVVAGGTGREAGSVINARGKTGTTDENKDAWFCGYTNELVGIGWISNEIRDSSRNRWVYRRMSSSVFGGTVTVEMWSAIMSRCQNILGEKWAKMPYVDMSGDSKTIGEAAPTDETLNKSKGPDETEDPFGPLPPLDEVPDRTNNKKGGEDTGPDRTNANPDEASGGGVTSTDPAEEKKSDPPANTDPPKRNEDPPKRREDPPRREEEATVSTEICADSGARASVYCPERIRRTFKKGEAPRGRCPIHRS